jgi:hypothetical protein
MNNVADIAAAETRAARAESSALDAQIRLAVTRARLDELETAETRRNDAAANHAVRQLVSAGVIKPADTFAQHEMKSQFVSDPALIPLAVGRPFNRRVRRP